MIFAPTRRKFQKIMLAIDTCSRSVACCLGLLVLQGCSFNDFGFVNVNTRETYETRTRHIVANGLRIETRGPMAGLSFGRVEALHLHIKSCGRLAPRLHYQETAGLQLVASSLEFGLTLGRREVLLAATGAPNGASAVRFDPASPERASIEISLSDQSNCQLQNQRKNAS
ncbi:hypothetical protein KX928_04775 [Roseobacter sp. YSTF-M11]|uniref:Uncharacterized protein n=1 Tax=Roseobacter insulae TaxID=2859783 RepID=A0A9X1K223_9RHOB|nr:hypothetical protein [Roseobacter insulae]MBW4707097.1 hypothetical protein [Roseobacter insulae]